MTVPVHRSPQPVEATRRPHQDIRFPVVAIAASTSGPQALRHLLSALPEDFPAGIVVAQHLSDGFAEGLATWLRPYLAIPVQVARDMTLLRPGTVYLAPDGCHLVVRGTRIRTPKAQPDEPWRPSANHLFVSVAESFGPLSVAVVLTGMGKDGTEGAIAIKQAGGRVIVQDLADAAVIGMPKSVVESGAYDIVLPLDAMGSYLIALTHRLVSTLAQQGERNRAS